MDSRGGSFLGEPIVLFIAWAVRLSLERQRHGDDDAYCRMAKVLLDQLLRPGDPLDILRSRASLAPRSSTRTGLSVQPFFWSLALAMIDLVNDQYWAAEG